MVANLQATQLDETGLAYDFVELKRYLGEILVQFDHTCLNDVSPFDEINPSSENIATTIYNRLQPRFSEDVLLASIEVWESPQSCITYIPD